MDPQAPNKFRYVRIGLILLLLTITAGTTGLVLIEHYPVADALYMTVITISTVGFGEVHELSVAGRGLIIGLIIIGLALVTYTVGALGSIIVEGQFKRLLGRNKMNKELATIKDHYVICGFGRMGQIVCDALEEQGRPLVVITNLEEEYDQIISDGRLAVFGDATEDESLLKAGLLRARGLVAVVSSDVDNLYITLSARELARNGNAELYILARASGPKSQRRIKHAGANRAIAPYLIGGSRLVDALLRPHVFDYMEVLSQNSELDLMIEELEVGESASIVGLAIMETNLRNEYDLIIIGVTSSSGEKIFNPKSGYTIAAGDTLILLGNKQQLARLEKELRS
ncbi:MAG: potassium channel protein [bacterium]|nr:potassium channel protein [bacterium]MCP4800076.1 potassium channel protein [bacterium]